MHSTFAVVIVVVCGLGVLVAVFTLFGPDTTWKKYEDQGMVMERPRAGTPGADGAGAEAEEEIRQMLEAANARRARRGEPTVDVEAEFRRLTAGSDGAGPATRDPEVVAEVRALVEKRNARRLRHGETPLDVEAEVAARLAELDG